MKKNQMAKPTKTRFLQHIEPGTLNRKKSSGNANYMLAALLGPLDERSRFYLPLVGAERHSRCIDENHITCSPRLTHRVIWVDEGWFIDGSLATDVSAP